MSKKVYLAYIAYLTFSLLGLLLLIQVITNPFQVDVELPEHVQSLRLEERKKLPTQQDFQKLEQAYEQVSIYLGDEHELQEQIRSLYEQTTTAIVCSDTNRYFNKLEEVYKQYIVELTVIQEQIDLYEQQYQDYVELLENIPTYSRSYREAMFNKFHELIEPKYQKVCAVKESYLADKKEMDTLYQNAHQLADALYEEYHDIMSRLVTREAGNCPLIEICYVARVVENRILSPRFPNTLLEVIYAPNQYAPAMNGSINLPPYENVVEIMEDYLRGRIEVDMPSNVFYQALFIPGGSKGVWKHMDSGHYFCFG